MFKSQKGWRADGIQNCIRSSNKRAVKFLQNTLTYHRKDGVLIACADARYCSGMDNPNRIDKVIRRSFDCGETWEDAVIAVEEHGTKQMKSSAAIDPVMVYSKKAAG